MHVHDYKKKSNLKQNVYLNLDPTEKDFHFENKYIIKFDRENTYEMNENIFFL